MRKCSRCENIKNISEFYRRGDSYRSHCKACLKEKRLKNNKKKSNYDKEYYSKNKSRIDSRAQKYAQENQEKVKEGRKKALPKILEKRRQRYKKDLGYKLTCNLRSRFYCALKRNKKAGKTLNLLGCSIEEFKKYIQNQFTKGMSWDGVMSGEIHIDHIKPCAKFDLTKPEEQKKCFHYTNLQPLWAIDNYRKNDKY